MNADVLTIPAPADWWEPLRANIKSVCVDASEKEESTERNRRPIVTYINR